MNDDFPTLYAYNRWADRLVLDACRTLSPEQYTAEPTPGWSSVRSTVVHLAIVTDGWLYGLTGEDAGAPPTEADLPTVDDAARLLDRADATFATLSEQMASEWLATPMTLRRGER